MKQKITFALIMGVITTGIISFTVIAVNFGFPESFVRVWFRSWVMAYVIVIPCIIVIGPKVQQAVEHLFREKNDLSRIKEI